MKFIFVFLNSLGPSYAIWWQEIWVNVVGTSNGLLPDGTKPSHEPMLTDHQQFCFVVFTPEQFHKECSNIYPWYAFEITTLALQSYFPSGQWVKDNQHPRVTDPLKPGDACIHHLTHWGRVTHKCVSKLAIIGSDNGLSPGRRQAIIWTNAGILLIGPLGTNFSETSIEIYTFSFKKIHLKLSSGKWRPFYLGLNVLTGSSVEMACCLFSFKLLPESMLYYQLHAKEQWLNFQTKLKRFQWRKWIWEYCLKVAAILSQPQCV